MNDPTIRFDDVDEDTWRARVEQGGRTIAGLAHHGLEDLEVAALYSGGPARAVVVPPRARATWACLAMLPDDATRALAMVRRMDAKVVDGVWIDATHAAVIVSGLPAGLAAYVAGPGEPGALRVDGWLDDPCAPQQSGDLDAAARRVDARALRTWMCDGAAWHDAGATAIDEVACVLAGVFAGLRALGARGVSASAAAASMLMRVGLGGDVLVDVAKLRALRGLWHGAASKLGLDSAAIPVHARTARRVRSRLDPDTNLVRATYELFAAATTGVDALVVEPHDGGAADGGPRWARNLVHLMRHESHLERVDDPFAGAFAIERLTAAIARAAWARVQAIEAAGGLGRAVADGVPQAWAEAAAKRRREAIAAGTHPIVGVSKFPPPHPAAAPPAGPSSLDLCAAYETGGAK